MTVQPFIYENDKLNEKIIGKVSFSLQNQYLMQLHINQSWSLGCIKLFF